MTDFTLRQMGQAVYVHLTRDDARFVAAVAMRESARFAVLLSAYHGTYCTEADFARLMLRIAKQLDAPGGAS